MARPWQPRLFVFAGLHEKPQVRQIAQALGMDADAVVGKLLRFWIEAQVKATPKGELLGKPATWLDLLVGRPGFAVALAEADWLRVLPDRLVVPDFDDFISKRAVKRIEDAHRKAALREVADPDDRHGYSSDLPRHTATPGDKVVVPPVVADVKPTKEAKKRVVKEKPVGPVIGDPRFWTFWRAYPKPHNQPGAVIEWDALNADDDLVAEIMAGLELWKQSEEWVKENGRYIPQAKNFLLNRKWTEPVNGRPVRQGARIKSGPGEGSPTKRAFQLPPTGTDPHPGNSLF